jgi:hypothetical protein
LNRVKIVIAASPNGAHCSSCFNVEDGAEANDTEERMRVRFVKAAAAASLLALSVAACGQETGTAGQQQAQQVSLEGKSVTASGCVRPVESTSCIVVRGPGGGYYDISGAAPAPDPTKGVAISLQGRDLGENTQCGRKLADVKWSYLNIQCAALTPAAAPATETEKAG